MPKPCPNHGKYGDKEKAVAMKKLADALNLLWDGVVKPSRGVKQQLRFVEIWPGVQGLEMDIVLISFRKESRLTRHKIAFTVDRMLSDKTRDIARQINDVIREKLEAD